jgi:hypothetical protein
VLALSTRPIDKEHIERPRLEDRVSALRDDAQRSGGWLDVVVTDHRLLVDIARDYDVLIMGADKWAQVNDPVYYDGSTAARDAALAALPELAIAPRPPLALPAEYALLIDATHATVSSSAVRGGSREWMSPGAVAFDARTGAWTDPARYDRWLAEHA